MMNATIFLHVEQFEHAINIWRARHPSADGDALLCREARLLAEPYALMILHRATQIDAAQLTDEQREVLYAALA